MEMTPVCLLENFDNLTNTCSNIQWVVRESFLPSLSIDNVVLLSSSIISIFALAFSFKFLRKFLFRG